MFSIIVAMTQNKQVIWKNWQIPRYIPQDLRYFKKTTKWHSIIMGRKTFESIGKILPDRENIILTRNKNYKKMGVVVFYKIQDLIKYCNNEHNHFKNHFIIWWWEIYKQFLNLWIVNKIYATEIYKEYEWDTFFPEFKSKYKEISRKKNNWFDFVIYQKK